MALPVHITKASQATNPC